MNYRCTRCRNTLLPMCHEYPSCGQHFDQAIPDEATAHDKATAHITTAKPPMEECVHAAIKPK